MRMKWLYRLFRNQQMDSEVDKELAYHIERRVADLVAGGMEQGEAARMARLEMGGAGLVKEECRDARGTVWIHDFLRDGRHGLRLLRRSPGFACVALLLLAIGIGATTAIFTLMDRAILRPMPVHNAGQLVELARYRGERLTNHTYPHFKQLRSRLRSVEGMFAYAWLGEVDITIADITETARLELASGGYYSTLGIGARAGRTFDEDVDRVPGSNPVAVISEEYWRRRFGSDPNAIGRTFRLRGTLFTIIGVSPRDFDGVTFGRVADITVPTSMAAEVKGGSNNWLSDSSVHWLNVMCRVKGNIPLATLRSELAAVFGPIAAAEARESNDDRLRALLSSQKMEVQPAASGFDEYRRDFKQPLAILMGAVSLVLLLACANLANLMLARSSARQREIAVRLSLGAGRSRVIRQMLAEVAPLALAGGALGVVLSYGIAGVLVRMISNGGAVLAIDTQPDARVLGFALGLSLASCLLFGFAPAWQGMRQTLQPVLSQMRGARWRLGRGLMVWQMSLAVLLLIAAGLFGRTLLNVYSEPAGFRAENLILFSTNASRLQPLADARGSVTGGTAEHAGVNDARGAVTPERLARIPAEIVSELRNLPGVRFATVSRFPPVSGGSGWNPRLDVQGYQHMPSESNVSFANAIGPQFFETYGTPLLQGREFDVNDNENAPKVAIVNQTFARYYFKNDSPIGKTISLFKLPPQYRFTIVGMVADVKYEELRAEAPRTVYFPIPQVPFEGRTFAVRSNLSASAMAPLIGSAVARVRKELKPEGLRAMDEHLSRSLLRERILAILAGAFGVVALVLACIGIYGMMAFQVARRRKEIGIRVALGANSRSVLGMVLAQTARLTLLGCAIGVAAGLMLSRVAEGLLFGLQPTDPLTFAVAVVTLLVTAMLAAYLPGRSAAATNPAITLRAD